MKYRNIFDDFIRPDMKRFYILLLIMISPVVYAKTPFVNKDVPHNQTTPELNIGGTAYTIVVPGKLTSDGFHTPAKIYRIPQLPKEYYESNRIYIKTKDQVYAKNKTLSSVNLNSVLEKYGIVNIREPFGEFARGNLLAEDKTGIGRILEFQYAANIDPYEVCKDLVNYNEVEYAVPIFINFTDDFTPNDSLINKQWLINKIQLKKAWDITKGSKDVVIAIVDCGVDWTHEDLAANIWTNPDEIPDNGIDDDHNGKIDDVRGWDFVGNINNNQIAQGQFQEDNDPVNIKGTHGTHVAGCATAVTNNGKGVAGPGFNCSILPVKCGTDQGGKQIFRGYEGIIYAAKMGAEVINCSWAGSTYSPAGQDIINQAVAMGAVVVVAAGNEGSNINDGGSYPACFENVLCVGATSSNDKLPNWSNYGKPVTVYSPGNGIWSTMPQNQYQSQSGTSMASPVTAGVVGLVRSLHPDWEVKQVIQQIRSTSDNVIAKTPEERPMFYGRLNAYKAVDYNETVGKNVPGIAVQEVSFQAGDKIDSYEGKTVKIKVKNYLANTTNVKMTISPIGDYARLSQEEVFLGNMTSGTVKDVMLVVTLKDNNPWYFGTVDLLVKFESTDYENYDRVILPVQIESGNKYTQLADVPEEYQISWTASQSKAANNLWAIGTSTIFGVKGGLPNSGIYWINGSSGRFNATNVSHPIFALYAVDGNTAFAGTGSADGSAAEVCKTVNGGGNWTQTNVSSITGFINGIHFFDDNNGAFFGDPINGKWGVGVTNDGGKTWNSDVNIPAPETDEHGWVKSYFCLDDNSWFGSSTGKVYYSTDRGLTWKYSQIAGAYNIKYIGFIDDKTGFAVYTENEDFTSPLFLATTTDGGASWFAKRFNFLDHDLTPVKLFSLDGSGLIYIVNVGGQIISTKDGITFSSVLTAKQGGVQAGAPYISNFGKCRLWTVGSKIGYLDFNYEPINGTRKLSVIGSDTIVFDTTDIGSVSNKNTGLINNGSLIATINNIVIEPGEATDESEFYTDNVNSIEVKPAFPKPIRIHFEPKTIGDHTAKMTIKSDSDDGDVIVYLSGVGIEHVSVNEANANSTALLINPNPVGEMMNISFRTNKSGHVKIDIYDLNGNFAGNIFNGETTDGWNNFSLSSTGLSAGVYYARMTYGNKSHTVKFIKTR